jgi:prolyl-tRNA editing enzyme YbaK/EbsC (Cys-tRNA(Pro) deacylase)
VPEILSLRDFNYTIHTLSRNVVSCEDAAREKNIPLKNELKTLILTTSNGQVATHLSGDRKVDLRKIKHLLAVKEACLASKETLAKLGVQPGTASPFVDSIWNLKQLISNEIMSLDFVSTNNGELNEYVVFPPAALLINPDIMVGQFSK